MFKNVEDPKKHNYKTKTSVPKYKLLKTSWDVQTRLFFEYSTLHGVRYTAEEGRPFIEKLMWFCCVAFGAVATMVIIASLWEKFQTNPTITGLDTDFHNWDVPFPAITICQDVPANISMLEDFVEGLQSDDPGNITQFLSVLSQFSYKTLPMFKEYATKNFVGDDIDLKHYIYPLMNKCEDIFNECVWKGEPYTCCDGFFPIFTEEGFCYSFNSKFTELFPAKGGKAYPEFHLRQIEETDLKWSLKISVLKSNAEINFPIYIHNSDEVPGIDIEPQHVWKFKVDKISFSVKHTYTTEDTRQLTIRQRKCVFNDEVKLKISETYTYSSCARQCRMEMAQKLCGCVPHFYPKIEGFKHCKIKQLACIANNLEIIKSVDRCACQLGCLNAVYEVEKLNEHGNAEEANWALESQFVSWPMVRYKREVLFGWVDLLVSFGGIAGLFLGFSLLSGVEIIYYFTIRACCMVNREPLELEKIRREQLNKPKPDYDLSMIPYFVAEPAPNSGLKEISKRYHYYQRNISQSAIKPYQASKPFVVRDTKIGHGTLNSPFGIEFLP